MSLEANVSNPRVERDGYDSHLVPAETAARKDREGEAFKQIPEETVPEADIDTTGGYTVDQEGLLNNYAVEPEMYIDEPGDLRAEQEAEALERQRILREINKTREEGKVTPESDQRGKGVGII
ncbi:MAG: hypothetical protein HC929_07925 [Leptolyngbyaceae cyanobacterium SM2_5_2]|nr:hypothetical protein [Leptolyngbyaceae cyanobacterium SM2_5_2]